MMDNIQNCLTILSKSSMATNLNKIALLMNGLLYLNQTCDTKKFTFGMIPTGHCITLGGTSHLFSLLFDLIEKLCDLHA